MYPFCDVFIYHCSSSRGPSQTSPIFRVRSTHPVPWQLFLSATGLGRPSLTCIAPAHATEGGVDNHASNPFCSK